MPGDGETPAKTHLACLALGASKFHTFHTWKNRYSMVNEHNGQIPRDHWLENREKPGDPRFAAGCVRAAMTVQVADTGKSRRKKWVASFQRRCKNREWLRRGLLPGSLFKPSRIPATGG